MTVKSWEKVRRMLLLLLCLSLALPMAGCGKEEAKVVIPEDLTLRPEDICTADGMSYVDGQLLLVAKEGTSYRAVERLVKGVGGEIIGYISFSRDYHIGFSGGKTYGELTDLVRQLGSEEAVETVSLHRVYALEQQSVNYQSDPWGAPPQQWSQLYPMGNNWWAEAIRMPEVWEMDLWDTVEKGSVKLGIIDGSFDLGHRDLDEVMVLLRSCASGAVSFYHGTFGAGIIGAELGNDVGIAGVASCAKPVLYGFSVASVPDEGGNWHGFLSEIYLKYAIASMLMEGVKAINISLGMETVMYAAEHGTGERKAKAQEALADYSGAMCRFLKDAISFGYDFLLVKAAGNESNDYWEEVSFDENPFGYKKVGVEPDRSTTVCHARFDLLGAIEDPQVRSRIVMVGAARQDYTLPQLGGTGYDYAPFSVRGADVYAPGQDVLSIAPGTTQTAVDSGTSFAAPIVTGVAGLIWAANPELSAPQVKQILCACAGNPETLQAGERITVVDAAAAVRAALGMEGAGGDAASSKAVLTGFVYAHEHDENEKLVRAPAVETRVLIKREDGTVTERYTNGWGSFDAFLDPGTYTIQIQVPGYFYREVAVSLGESEAVYQPIRLYPMPVVSDAYHVHAPSYEKAGGIRYHIPRVNLTQGREAPANEIMYQDLIGYVNRDISWDLGMYYSWANQEDVVSILVRAGEDYNTAVIRFHVYNVSAESGELLPKSAVVAAAGLSEEQYYGRLHEKIDEYYRDHYFSGSSGEVSSLAGQSHAAENLEAAMPYLNDQGDLCVVLKIYTLAGAGFRYDLYNLTGKVKPEWPEASAGLGRNCLELKGDGTLYGSFVESGCYTACLATGETPTAYAVLDVDGDGLEELVVDVGTFSPEFHDHLVFAINEEVGLIDLAGRLYSYMCLRHSEDLGALGYVYPRATGTILYHCMGMEKGVLYESYTLSGNRQAGSYLVEQFDPNGNRIAFIENNGEVFERHYGSFEDLTWHSIP